MKGLARMMLVGLGRDDCLCLDLSGFATDALQASADGRPVPVCPTHGVPEYIQAAQADGRACAAQMAKQAASLPLNAPPAAYPSLAGMGVEL